MARIHRGSEKAIHEANLTPLIDVSLVLVVILLVATPLAFQSSFGVNTASDSAKNAAAPADEDRIEMTVHANGDVTINRQRVGANLLAPAILDAVRASTSRLVVVRCEDDVPHGTFVRAIDTAKLHGAARIAVVGR
jgi:biopolymer transport protein ExbD